MLPDSRIITTVDPRKREKPERVFIPQPHLLTPTAAQEANKRLGPVERISGRLWERKFKRQYFVSESQFEARNDPYLFPLTRRAE